MRLRRRHARADQVPPAPPIEPTIQAGPLARPRRRGWLLAGILVGMLAGGAAVAGALIATDNDPVATADEAQDRSTAALERRDLVEYTDLDGTLGYPGTEQLVATSDGTLTAVPDVGEVLERGDTLYEVNETPIVLFYGDTPAWRELAAGIAPGADVRQLEENLVALGYDPDAAITVDGVFDDATSDAIKRWEEDLGLEVNGIVELGSVVFLPGRLELAQQLVTRGGAAHPGTAVIEVTLADQVETVDARYPRAVGDGTINDVLPSGSAVERGDVLYSYAAADDIEFDPDVFERELSIYSDPGDDIRQLEKNLRDLGYDPDDELTIDNTFDQATADAVARWERDLGIDVNGVVELEQFSMDTESDAVTHVAAIIGDMQLGRELSVHAQPGEDIRMLEENLAALGYDEGLTVDDIYDEATAEAVARWEADLGNEADGIVQVGQVVAVPEGATVGDVHVEPGEWAAYGRPLLDLLVTRRVVTAQLPVDDADLLAEGDSVEVELPDGTTVAGVVTEISTIARADQASGDTVLDVTIALAAFESELELSAAPVEINVVSSVAEDVLAAPVSALLALAEGGYALEVINPDGRTRLVAVETGEYADSWVEVSGDGLSEGMEVVVAR